MLRFCTFKVTHELESCKGVIKAQECYSFKNKQKSYFHWAKPGFQKWKYRGLNLCRYVTQPQPHSTPCPAPNSSSPPQLGGWLTEQSFPLLQIKFSNFLVIHIGKKTQANKQTRSERKIHVPKEGVSRETSFFYLNIVFITAHLGRLRMNPKQ